jgi:hypothetical protein
MNVTVERAIFKKIERRIQSHLFERGNGGLETTASGRVL